VRSFIREKKIYCGNRYREVDIYTYTDAQKTASRRGTRSKKVRESEPKQKNLNDKNARRYFIQTANLNFGEDPGALHVSATYSAKHLPATVDEAEREVSNYLRRVQYGAVTRLCTATAEGQFRQETVLRRQLQNPHRGINNSGLHFLHKSGTVPSGSAGRPEHRWPSTPPRPAATNRPWR